MKEITIEEANNLDTNVFPFWKVVHPEAQENLYVKYKKQNDKKNAKGEVIEDGAIEQSQETLSEILERLKNYSKFDYVIVAFCASHTGKNIDSYVFVINEKEYKKKGNQNGLGNINQNQQPQQTKSNRRDDERYYEQKEDLLERTMNAKMAELTAKMAEDREQQKFDIMLLKMQNEFDIKKMQLEQEFKTKEEILKNKIESLQEKLDEYEDKVIEAEDKIEESKETTKEFGKLAGNFLKGAFSEFTGFGNFNKKTETTQAPEEETTAKRQRQPKF